MQLAGVVLVDDYHSDGLAHAKGAREEVDIELLGILRCALALHDLDADLLLQLIRAESQRPFHWLVVVDGLRGTISRRVFDLRLPCRHAHAPDLDGHLTYGLEHIVVESLELRNNTITCSISTLLCIHFLVFALELLRQLHAGLVAGLCCQDLLATAKQSRGVDTVLRPAVGRIEFVLHEKADLLGRQVGVLAVHLTDLDLHHRQLFFGALRLNGESGGGLLRSWDPAFVRPEGENNQQPEESEGHHPLPRLDDVGRRSKQDD
mmetsp:Transcript_22407/g.64422  ORF Transcript_22407/g.64422 Transcript_22407/m.64422 type:complete len:263 (+) Transcript_22407:510-1298(+)